MAARSSQDLACCRRATSRARSKYSSAFAVSASGDFSAVSPAVRYALANKGLDTRTLQAYLGHRSINSTTRYAALAPGRFKNIWGRVYGLGCLARPGGKR
jgi:site-specific recombinase XerD